MTEANDPSSTRIQIIQAAIVLFGSKGFLGTRIREICAASNTNTGLIKYYFPAGKEELWKECVKYCMTHFENDYAAQEKKLGDAGLRKRVEAYLRNTVILSAKHPQVHRFVQTTTVSGNKALVDWMSEEFIRPLQSQIIDLIVRGQKAGFLTQCDPIVMLYMVLGASGLPYWTELEVKTASGRQVFAEKAIEEHANAVVATFLKQP